MNAKTAVQGLKQAGIAPEPGERLDDYLNRGGKTILRRMYDDLTPARREWALDKLRADGVDTTYLEKGK